MNTEHIASIFVGIDEFTKERIVRNIKAELTAAIKDVNVALIAHCEASGKPVGVAELSPQPGLIMESFRRCSLSKVKVAIIAQDPFINPGEATGLCFSVPVGKKIPPSTRNMYKCLEHSGFFDVAPTHGDLSHWADQGVLMLNASLTTVLGKSNAHAKAWHTYTDAVIQQISALEQRVLFILLGGDAQKKVRLIDPRHIRLEWSHPSPQNPANRTEGPAHFKYCNVFTRANKLLVEDGRTPIQWGNLPVVMPASMPTVTPLGTPANISAPKFIDVGASDETATVTMPTVLTAVYVHPETAPYAGTYTSGLASPLDPAPMGTPTGTSCLPKTLWIFSDGGATANGKPECEASWAFFFTDGVNVARAHGLVEPKFLPGCKFRASNNRGELVAILHALEYLLGLYDAAPAFVYNNVVIISDSDLSIKGIDERDLIGKMNVDLLAPAKNYIAQLRAKTPVVFKHVRASHDVVAPTDPQERFQWQGNNIVDSLCNAALGLNDKKQRIDTNGKVIRKGKK